mgnify:CR=1 FL=1
MCRQAELDARGLLCPLPVIRTQDRVAALAAGTRLTVHCSDPGCLQDIPAWCRINGHRVLEAVAAGREVRVVLEVGAAGPGPAGGGDD